MKKKLLTLGAAVLLTFTLTGCDGVKVDKEVAKQKMEAAEEKIETYKGAKITCDSSVKLNFNASLAFGSNSATSSFKVNTSSDASFGYLLDESRQNVTAANFKANASFEATGNLAGAEGSASDSLSYDLTYNPSTNKFAGTKNSGTNVSLDANTFFGIAWADCGFEGYTAAKHSFSLTSYVESATQTYGEPEYYKSFGNYSAKYELSEAYVKAELTGLFESADADGNTSSVAANLFADANIKSAYAKFTFNEDATKLVLDFYIKASASAKASFATFSSNASVDLECKSTTKISLVNSL